MLNKNWKFWQVVLTHAYFLSTFQKWTCVDNREWVKVGNMILEEIVNILSRIRCIILVYSVQEFHTFFVGFLDPRFSFSTNSKTLACNTYKSLITMLCRFTYSGWYMIASRYVLPHLVKAFYSYKESGIWSTWHGGLILGSNQFCLMTHIVLLVSNQKI